MTRRRGFIARLCQAGAASTLVAALVSPVAAPAAETAPITLDEALRLALDRNERVAIAAEDLWQARLDLRGAWLRLLPTLSLGATLRVNDRQGTVPVAGGGVRVVQEQVAPTGWAQAAVTLFEPRTVPGIITSDAGVDVAVARTEVVRYDLSYSVIETYLAVGIARNAVRAAERSVQTAREILRITSARVDVGQALPIDRLRSELAVTRAEATLIASKAALAEAREQLRFLIGAEHPVQIAEGSELLTERLAVGLVEGASGGRPDLRLLGEQLEEIDAVTDWDWLSFAPALTALGRYQISTEGGFTNQNERGWLELGLVWTLVSGGEPFLQLSRNRSLARQGQLTLAWAERQAIFETTAARERLEAARSAVLTARERLALAREARAQILLSYEAGRASALDLLESEDELQAAEIGKTAGDLDLAERHVDLMRALGIDPLATPAAAPQRER